MGKRETPSGNLDEAMADALAAVERVEGKTGKPVNSREAKTRKTQPDQERDAKSGQAASAGDEAARKTDPVIDSESNSSAPADLPAQSTERDAKDSTAPDEEGAGDAEKQEDPEAVLRDRLLRLAADFENYRKRVAREAHEARRYGIEGLLRDLLPVIDNLDRALAHAEGEKNPVIDGIRLVGKQCLDVLANYGVKSFSSLGQPFDPERHEAVGQAPGGEMAPGTVLEEMAKGYFLHDRLLRPAHVIVAASPPEEEESEGNSTETEDQE